MNRLLRIRRTLPNLPAFVLMVGAVLGGCQSPGPQRATEEALTDSLAEGYQWLEAQYERMGEAMPPAMRGMRSRMQAMHGRMMEGRSGRMGRMKERMGKMKGMMGERGAEGPVRDTTGQQFRMGHRVMSAMHETMARMHSERRARMAARHQKMARWHEKMMGGSSEESSRASGETTQVPDDVTRSGAAIFTQQCASCHGQSGQGISGTFPPVADSKWVTGDVSVAARIVLHGLEGPVEVRGQRYDGVMPAFGGRLSDAEVAGLLTFLRTSLDDGGSPVSAEEIERIREDYADRNQAWTAEELQ